MSRTSPTACRRRLARELRKLRTEAKVGVEEAAREAGVARSTFQRWEAAESAVQISAVSALLRLYGVDEDDIPPLVEMARQSRRRGWWVPWNSALPEWVRDFVGLETEASEIAEFHPLLIPGLLQTAGYTEAIVRAEHPDDDNESVDRRVELRQERQRRGDDGPELWAIIGEAALQVPVGGRDVMREQLQRLLEATSLPRHNIQILPTGHGEHGAMGGGFIILRFADAADSPMVYLETRAGSLWVEEDSEVRQYTKLYQHLTASAASARKSARMIKQAMDTI